MPKKIRELKAMLLSFGFQFRSGKGSHTVWFHEKLSRNVVLSGRDGDDAKPYQEKEIRNVLKELQEKQ
jgi:predicted RNA binding protein YcfA (HicA-like mRNA interferase family)